jgi:RNA polymerase sigma factor (sigma-70 family)
MMPDVLFYEHMKWAEQIARKEHRKLPPSFDVDDLIQEAVIELHRRCGMYDAAKNDSFRGYAHVAIVGAVRMKTRRRHWKNATSEAMDATEVTQAVREQSQERQEADRQAQLEKWRETRRKALLRRRLRKIGGTEAKLAQLVFVAGTAIADAAAEMEMDEAKAGRMLRAVSNRLKVPKGRKPLNHQKLVKLIAECPTLSRVDMARVLGICERSVYRKIADLKARGILRERQSLFGKTLEIKQKDTFMSVGATAKTAGGAKGN